MKKAIKDHLTDFAAILGLFVIALGVGGYILANQRLRFPVIEDKPMKINAEFSTAQAITPGQGQTVNVSGVKIGDVGKVKLKNGRAIVELDIKKKYADLIHENATALLRPKTALKDMFVELQPGDNSAPRVKDGFTMPVANTLPDVNPDEFFAALDTDTRDYLKLLISGAGRGLEGRGDDLNEVFKRFEPTHKDLAKVNEKVAERHQNLRRLIHNLNVLNTSLATKDDELAQLVDAASRVFHAWASQDTNITRAVGDLPGALRQTTQTLQSVEQFSRILKPSLQQLTPAVSKIDEANAALKPLGEEAAPLLHNDIRPFVRQARPLVHDLRPSAGRLAKATPQLTRVFEVLNTFFNLAAYNPNGREAPDKPGREEGYLFWAAWLAHNGPAVFSTADANGTFRPSAIQASCASVKQTIHDEPQLEFLQGLTSALLDPRICPTG